jgi:amidase
VRDLRLCHQILTDQPVAAAAPNGVPRIRWTPRFATLELDDEVARVLDETLTTLSDAGADVTQTPAPIDMAASHALSLRLNTFEFWSKDYSWPLYAMLWAFEAVRSLAHGGISRSYRQLKTRQATLAASVADFLQHSDCWALPATSTVAFAHRRMGSSIPIAVDGRVRRCDYFSAAAGFTSPINLLGNPSVVMPVGKDKSGLPVAIQIVGRLGEDMKLLDVAACLSGMLHRSRVQAAADGAQVHLRESATTTTA